MGITPITTLLLSALAPAQAQTRIDTVSVPATSFDDQQVAATIEALRVDLSSLERPPAAPAEGPDLGTLIEAPGPVRMSGATVDLLPVPPTSWLKSPMIDPGQIVSCALEVDVGSRGRVEQVTVTECDDERPELAEAIRQTVSGWRFTPARFSGRNVAVAGAPLTLEVRAPRR